jgi:cell division GTPase FtsZ
MGIYSAVLLDIQFRDDHAEREKKYNERQRKYEAARNKENAKALEERLAAQEKIRKAELLALQAERERVWKTKSAKEQIDWLRQQAREEEEIEWYEYWFDLQNLGMPDIDDEAKKL